MYRILKKKSLNPTVTLMEIEAPFVARKARAGQFIILRADERGERIPLTVAGCNKETGAVTIIFQVVGGATMTLNALSEGECIADFVGPLGNPTEVEGIKKACVVGGGVGCAIALPIVRELHEMGCEVTSIVGFRSKDLVILEDEFRAASDKFVMMTDDGSYGEKGNVTLPLKRMLEAGETFDRVITIGPLVMMKFVALATKEYNIPHYRLDEPHHDRRHGYVRRLPPHRGRGDQVRLRGRARLRRPPRRLRRGDEAFAHLRGI